MKFANLPVDQKKKTGKSFQQQAKKANELD
jgi:hypothetical protein